jgi:hypothetical protein
MKLEYKFHAFSSELHANFSNFSSSTDSSQQKNEILTYNCGVIYQALCCIDVIEADKVASLIGKNKDVHTIIKTLHCIFSMQ